MADSDITSEEREVGVESMDCPTCGKKLATEEQPDGSVVAANCTKCHPAPTKKAIREQAEQQTELLRETGTDV